MNNEVSRLRRLRKTVLKLRALALALHASKPSRLYERASVLSWRIARIATGKLRSHPFRSYQQDQGYFESGGDRFNAYVQGALANLRGRGMQTLLAEINAAARELDDARALALAADLSDALGRAQNDMRALIGEVRLQLCRSTGNTAAECNPQGAPRSSPASNSNPSPYLAL
jgi:hypothetical protein